jgi:ribose-phosphate pyrophosphokinase
VSDPGAIVHAFPDSLGLAGRLAELLRAPLATVSVHRFPDGESRIRVEHRAGPALLVRSLDDPNPKLFELLLAASALRDAGASAVRLVAPYLPYMRQDRAFAAGEAVSQRVLGELLGRSFDALLCVEPHLHRVSALGQVFACDALSISAADAIAAWLRQRGEPTWIVGPDEESASWTQAIARQADMPFAVGRKQRQADDRVQVRLDPGQRAPCARALLVDDIASTGATLAAAAGALFEAGARTVEAAVVHAIFAPGAERRLRDAGIAPIVSCNTLAHASNAIDVAPLIANALAARGWNA